MNAEIDNTLWTAVRAIEERILLLEEMRDQEKNNDGIRSEAAIKQARDAEQQVEKLR